MELKFKKLDKEDTVKVCSNRTFMELKFVTRFPTPGCQY